MSTSRALLFVALAATTLQSAHAQAAVSTETSAPALGESVVSLGTPITVSTTVVDTKGNKVTTGTINFCVESSVNRALLRKPCGAFPLG